MCGISCILSLSGATQQRQQQPQRLPNGYIKKQSGSQREELEKDLNASLAQIAHRGPDACGNWISDDCRPKPTLIPFPSAALGHVRLSINDLSPSAAQPFHSPSHGIHAVVNGEFYDYDRIRSRVETETDYHFTSRSDSEIIIALYLHDGLNFTEHLRGEFACVLWDEPRQLFIAVRDRYGIKPLFWTIQPDGSGKGERRLLVAAEMKAFLPLGWEPEWDVRSLKDAGWNVGSTTLFRGVQKVRPGHYMTCQSFSHIEERPYWDSSFPLKTTLDPRTPEELIEGVRERMLESVRLRLRADVPVGVYLSGGIDSSVLAGMVAHLVKEQNMSMGSAPPSERVTCFSIAFDEDSGFDEGQIANRTAEWLGVKYLKKLMSEEELARRFEDAVWHCEQHNPDLNFVGKYALSEVPQEAGYKVVLTGEGADETFAGYPLYLPDYLREPDVSYEKHNPLPEAEREEQLRLAEDAVREHYRSMGADAGNGDLSTARKMLNGISTVSSMTAFQPDVFADWTDEVFTACDPQMTIACSPDGIARNHIAKDWHPLHSALYVWSKGHLPNIFLTCLGDRTEMAHSIEARTPFLDHELTGYVNHLPPSVKLRWMPDERRFVEKWILREASKPFITKELYERKKHPYSAPTKYPRNGHLHKLLSRLLFKEEVENLGFVSWEKLPANSSVCRLHDAAGLGWARAFDEVWLSFRLPSMYKADYTSLPEPVAVCLLAVAGPT
ncbi:Uu.00g020100.m01.CDS01 [Anthostomella pinea]|uniref:Uu.00g020100.m01.CDS01 n=1 Tax=Anthostomella pinea TaxID=933095 RepID=A0AAI8VZF7_9PEZI|nr:Uu.00g020100.m01.CDS01 [Anthostomella pinea]